MKIWVDADACPRMIKEVIFKVSARLKLNVILVANNQMNYPASELVSFIKVDQGADKADLYITENVENDDVVITADIPLASNVVQKNAYAINPRGEIYTKENVSERLSVRDFMQDLRDNGMSTEGPRAFDQKDKQNFNNAFDRLLTSLKKK